MADIDLSVTVPTLALDAKQTTLYVSLANVKSLMIRSIPKGESP